MIIFADENRKTPVRIATLNLRKSEIPTPWTDNIAESLRKERENAKPSNKKVKKTLNALIAEKKGIMQRIIIRKSKTGVLK
jgi:hypothetical protein